MSETQQQNGSDSAEQNDITKAYTLKADLNDLASDWEARMKEAGGSIGAKVTGSHGPTGTFNRGWWNGDESVEVGTTFTIPMDVPAWMIEQMRADFEAAGASVDIDMSTSVMGHPPKVKESGAVIPQGPSQEKIDAMDEADKTHTGKVEVTLDVTKQMQGTPKDLIIEGSRCSHRELGVVFVKAFSGTTGNVFVIPEDSEAVDGRGTYVQERELDLLHQFPEETQQSAWWNDF